MATTSTSTTRVGPQRDSNMVKPNVRPHGVELAPDTSWRNWRLREQREEIRDTYPEMWPSINAELCRRAEEELREQKANETTRDRVFRPRSLNDLRDYRPTRLQFCSLQDTDSRVADLRRATRPRKEYREEDYDKLPPFWFEEVSSSLFARVWELAADAFGQKDWGARVNERDWTSHWLRHLPVDFIRCASVIARGDPARKSKEDSDTHGYEFLFLDLNNRIYLCTAVIAKLLQENCFDDLLFGAKAQEKKTLNLLDRTTDSVADGYARKMSRYTTIHQYLNGDLFTDHFWQDVDQVTVKILMVLIPLINLIGEWDKEDSDEGSGALWPSLTEVHQRLHNIVAEAAWLANGTNYSRSCFWVEFPQPGQLWDIRQEHVTDINWKASSDAAKRKDNADFAQMMQTWVNDRDAAWEELEDAQDARQLNMTKEQWTMAVYLPGHPRPRSMVRRTAKVQIVLWPFFERYFPHRQNTANGGVDNDGDSTNTVQKAQVVYYAGKDDDEGDQFEDFTLAQHLSEWKTRNTGFLTGIFASLSSFGSFYSALLVAFLGLCIVLVTRESFFFVRDGTALSGWWQLLSESPLYPRVDLTTRPHHTTAAPFRAPIHPGDANGALTGPSTQYAPWSMSTVMIPYNPGYPDPTPSPDTAVECVALGESGNEALPSGWDPAYKVPSDGRDPLPSPSPSPVSSSSSRDSEPPEPTEVPAAPTEQTEVSVDRTDDDWTPIIAPSSHSAPGGIEATSQTYSDSSPPNRWIPSAWVRGIQNWWSGPENVKVIIAERDIQGLLDKYHGQLKGLGSPEMLRTTHELVSSLDSVKKAWADCTNLDDGEFCKFLQYLAKDNDHTAAEAAGSVAADGNDIDVVKLRDFWQAFEKEESPLVAARGMLDMAEVPLNPPKTQSEIDKIKKNLLVVLKFWQRFKAGLEAREPGNEGQSSEAADATISPTTSSAISLGGTTTASTMSLSGKTPTSSSRGQTGGSSKGSQSSTERDTSRSREARASSEGTKFGDRSRSSGNGSPHKTSTSSKTMSPRREPGFLVTDHAKIKNDVTIEQETGAIIEPAPTTSTDSSGKVDEEVETGQWVKTHVYGIEYNCWVVGGKAMCTQTVIASSGTTSTDVPTV